MEIPSLYAPLKFDTGAEQMNQQLQLKIADETAEIIRGNREYADNLERTTLQQNTFEEWKPQLKAILDPYSGLSKQTSELLQKDPESFLQSRQSLREAGKSLYAELTQGEASKLTGVYNQFQSDYAKALADKEYDNSDVNIIFGAHKKNIIGKPGQPYNSPTLVKRPDIDKIRREVMADMQPTEITNKDGSKSKYYDPNVLAALIKQRLGNDQDVNRYFQVMSQYAPDQYGAVIVGRDKVTGQNLYEEISRDKNDNIVYDKSGNPIYRLTTNPKNARTRKQLEIENQAQLAALTLSGSTNVEAPVDKNNPANSIPIVNITEKASPLIPADKETHINEQTKVAVQIKELDKIIDNKSLPDIDKEAAIREKEQIVTTNENNKSNIRYLTSRTIDQLAKSNLGYTKDEINNVLLKGAIPHLKEKIEFIKKNKKGLFGRLSPELQKEYDNTEAQLNRAERIKKDYNQQYPIEEKKLHESYNVTNATVSVYGADPKIKQALVQTIGANLADISSPDINNDTNSSEHKQFKEKLRILLDTKGDNINDYIQLSNVSANKGGGSLVIRGTLTKEGITHFDKTLNKEAGDPITLNIEQGGEAFFAAIRNSNNPELTKWSEVAQNPIMTNISRIIEKIPLPLEGDVQGPIHIVKEGGITAKISKSPRGTIVVKFKNDKGLTSEPMTYSSIGEATEQIYRVILDNQRKK